MRRATENFDLKEYMYYHEQNFGRDMNVKGVSGDALEEKDEHIIDMAKISIIKWQESWLNCVLMLGGK